MAHRAELIGLTSPISERHAAPRKDEQSAGQARAAQDPATRRSRRERWAKCGSPATWCRWRRIRAEGGTNRRSGGWRKHGGGGATKGAGCGAVGAWISGVKWGNPRESGGSDKLEPGHSLWKLPKESAHGYGACTRAVRGLVGRGAEARKRGRDG